MRVVEATVSNDGRRALVVLRPSWLGRLFGATSFMVELEWDGFHDRWRSLRTKRPLTDLRYGDRIRSAFECRPVGAAAEVPYAIVVSDRARKPG